MRLSDLVETLKHQTRLQRDKVTFSFDDDDDNDRKLFKDFEAYVREHKGLYPTYRFWYDGSNYGGEAYIIAVRDGIPYKGSCWSKEYTDES